MAIPDSPNWAQLAGAPQAYIAYPFPQPLPVEDIDVQNISVGPLVFESSQARIDERYWVAYQIGNDVVLSGAVGDVWDTPQVLFAENDEVTAICLTFDQLGRAVVFYQTLGSNVFLHWFDPTAAGGTGAQVITDFGVGSSPVCAMDYPENTSDANSDVMIFYARTDRIFWRLQRERYQTEYDPGVNIPGLIIFTAGKNVGNKFQVIYVGKS